MTRGLNKLD